MIVKARVTETYEVMLRCDNCRNILRPSGFDSKAGAYVYKCTCGFETLSKLCYPFTQAVFDPASEKVVTEDEVVKEG